MKAIRIIPRGHGRFAVVRYVVAHRRDGTLAWRADMIVRGAATIGRLEWEGYTSELYGSLHGRELSEDECARYYADQTRGK